MSKLRSNSVYANSGFWYIRYKDPVEKQWKAVSTKLKATKRNFNQAQKFRDELFSEISKLEELAFRQGDIKFAFEHFKEINANKSDATKATYEIFYSYLIQKISPDTICHIINKKVAEDFLLWLSKLTHIQQNTKFGIQKNFLKFLRFLFEYEYIPRIFILNKDVKVRSKVNEPLIFSEADRTTILNGLSKDHEISKLLTQEKKNKKYKKKQIPKPYIKNSNFRLMVMMLMYTGLRPSDIINVTIEQVDLEKMELKFYSSKIDKWFIRPIHEALKEILAARIKEVGTGRLFDYDDVKTMGKAFNRYLVVISLSGKGYTLRTFRKDFISRCQEAGVSIATTALLVGHSNIKTTMTYYTKLSSQHLTDELSKLK
jgi:integrase